MKTFTIAEVAKATGVNKQTVRRRARELGIYDQMVPKDARGTMVMTAEQASMLSDAVMKAAPEQMSTIGEEADKERAQAMHDALVESLRETIDALKDNVEDLRVQVERVTSEKDAEIEKLRDENRRLERELARVRDYARQLEHAHWWEKRRVISAFALLPAASE